jgi:hypothetical protein
MDSVPIGLRKMKEVGLYNVIFELDLGDMTLYKPTSFIFLKPIGTESISGTLFFDPGKKIEFWRISRHLPYIKQILVCRLL